MLTPERHRIILQLLEEKEVVKLQELVEATNSSESTIRRDLSQLEKEKKLKRVHGGAALLHQKREELSVFEKSTKNIQEKQLVGKYAASLIRDGDCIYLDAGTTTLQMIPYIEAKDIVVVTNGITHLEALLEKDIPTYLVGGLIKKKTKALIGRGALASLESYSFDKCFIGVNGIHIDYGYTTPDPEEALIKQTAMKLSRQAFILADHSKLNESTFAKIADLQEATIIIDEIDEELLALYEAKTTVEVVKK
ncbi:DeoR family transcriptional regulator [Thermolongibacillus altinsuensis]|uniref:DeoR family transcriptional regulator n=1 Tax=Thermolongibacillus altinsuensis TaxID=575256 RepID=A0A4R1QCU2_9BACL|nr:DeoR/GlpR family DNA-binding transcription regulator [Thermolongibacillus altinsuensis]TCL48062.1 DeoR family transcriptional regulator [Thermolongibacillus altinsuensis]GMB09678.1 DeoR family transcriptional regulator [Thermolongibacillus altinsuensis]